MEHKSSNYGIFLTFLYTDSLIDTLSRDSEWKVLFTLLKYMNWKTGISYPSAKRIQAETDLGQRTVFDAIGRLEKKGVISKTKAKFGADTPYYNNVYKIIGWNKSKMQETQKVSEAEIEEMIKENLL